MMPAALHPETQRDVERLLRILTILRAEQGRPLDAETLELVAALRQDYPWIRVLDDGSIAAASPLLTTTGVYLGMTRTGWEARYCYTDFLTALEVLYALKSEDDVPAGWVARRPEVGPRCPRCARVSHHPSDIAQGYCAACCGPGVTHQIVGDVVVVPDNDPAP